MIKTAIGLLAFVIAAYMLALTVKDLVITIRLGGPTGGTAGAYSYMAAQGEFLAVKSTGSGPENTAICPCDRI